MSKPHDEISARDAEFVQELARLRALLRQADTDALDVAADRATEIRLHAKEMKKERARTLAAKAETSEVRHRLKNNLAVVQAIANATLRSGLSIEEARTAFNARLEAYARAQEVLIDSGWSGADLSTLVGEVLGPYVESHARRFRTTGPALTLGSRQAFALALAMNELATNAAKYGAFSDDDGHVELTWTLEPGPGGEEFRLLWQERNGPDVAPPSRKGFGTRLIEDNLAAEINGSVKLDYAPHGVSCVVFAPRDALG
ncbi:sensor histidine kinase [Mesorhizobium sp. 1B3]|uniref:sensor histidine kinase n=1 Tax=Mesorhizobium sp. 1B3 TaxID=3243599 RepID=UPI003D98AFA9